MEHSEGRAFKTAKLTKHENNSDMESMTVAVPALDRVYNFLFDKHDSTLKISDGRSSAVLPIDGVRSLKDVAKELKLHLRKVLNNKDLSVAHGLAPYVYPTSAVRREVLAWLKEHGIDRGRFEAGNMPMTCSWDTFDGLVSDITHHFDYYQGLRIVLADVGDETMPDDSFDRDMNLLIPDYATQIANFGINVNPFYTDAVEALRLGLRQLKKQSD